MGVFLNIVEGSLNKERKKFSEISDVEIMGKT